MTRLAALILSLILLLPVPSALAHALLVDATPGDGAVIPQAPAQVKLRFNEPVTPVVLRVLDTDGHPIADNVPSGPEADTLTLTLPADLAAGTYVVSYRVISQDSHAVGGTVTFSIGDAQPVRDDVVREPSSAPLLALVVTRTLFLTALLTVAGVILALWLVADFEPEVARRSRPVVLGAGIAALALAVLLLGVAGCHFAGVPLSGLGDGNTWRLAATSSLARSLAVAATGVALILIAVPRLHLASHRAVALAGSLIVFGSFAIGGHAATASPQGLMRWAVPLHALCAAFWIGALPILLSAARNEAPERTLRLLRRFSAYSLVAVTLLVALGVVIAFVQVSHFGALWETAYGLVLIGKIGAAAVLLAGAAHNKWRASPLLALGSASVQSTFTRGVCAEYVVFAAILALTATLGQIEPPRATVEQARSAGFTATRKQDDYTVALAMAPARTGRNALSLAITDNTGQPVSAQEVTLDLAFPAAGIPPLHRKATQDVSGRFAYVGEDFTLAGRWRVDVTIVMDDLTKTTVSFDVPVR